MGQGDPGAATSWWQAVRWEGTSWSISHGRRGVTAGRTVWSHDQLAEGPGGRRIGGLTSRAHDQLVTVRTCLTWGRDKPLARPAGWRPWVGEGGPPAGRPAETQPVGQWCWVGAVLDRDGGRGREGDQLVRSAGRRIGGRSDDQLVTGGGRVWPGAHDLRFTTSWSQERAPPQTRFLLLTRGGVDGRPTTWTTTSWSHPWGRSEPGTA